MGDPDKAGNVRRLPVDVFYQGCKLVVEYHERQHTEAVSHFDKPHKMTVSGVHRGIQRKLYDKRRAEILPRNGIALVVFGYEMFSHSSNRRLKRTTFEDREIIRRKLATACS